MVAFIPFFGLMVAFIPKIALMATIRFYGNIVRLWLSVAGHAQSAFNRCV